jgi:putative endonuclease
MERGGYIYILCNTYNTTFYIGVTSNLFARVSQHKEFLVEGFTKRYILTKLVYYEIFQTIDEAIAREKQLKSGSRKKKIDLITKDNPDFRDLIDDIEI